MRFIKFSLLMLIALMPQLSLGYSSSLIVSDSIPLTKTEAANLIVALQIGNELKKDNNKLKELVKLQEALIRTSDSTAKTFENLYNSQKLIIEQKDKQIQLQDDWVKRVEKDNTLLSKRLKRRKRWAIVLNVLAFVGGVGVAFIILK